MDGTFVLDRYGNNAAIKCLSCGRAFVISQLLNKKSGRLCPHCENARAQFDESGQISCILISDSKERETRVREILAEVKPLAAEFYRLTSKPLGVTGEVAEFVASELLGLKLAPARTPGHDATRGEEKIQIKGRAYGLNAKPGQRMSRIKLDAECDTVLLVLLDNATLEAREMWEAPYLDVCTELSRAGSKARDRGSLGVSAFKKVATLVWTAKQQVAANSIQ